MVTCSVEEDGVPCDGISYCRTMCRKHYKRWYKWGDPLKTAGFTERGTPMAFLQDVASMDIAEECVLWPYGCNSKGYPLVSVEGRHKSAGQVVLRLVGADQPSPHHDALHSCDNPKCVAWWHLRWGTQTENTDDARRRGVMSNQHGPWS